VETINSVSLNGQPLPAGSDYCTVPGRQWLSFKSPLLTGDQLLVVYDISLDRDLAVTNWDSNIGNYLFYNQTNPPVGIAAQPVNPPEKFELFQNYPNPFNPATNIGFRISGFGFVSLKVYNVTGREVAALVSENLIPGEYKYRWDAGGLASGVYFYKLEAGSFVQTKEMLLIR
jgi:hypothetical protein